MNKYCSCNCSVSWPIPSSGQWSWYLSFLWSVPAVGTTIIISNYKNFYMGELLLVGDVILLLRWTKARKPSLRRSWGRRRKRKVLEKKKLSVCLSSRYFLLLDEWIIYQDHSCPHSPLHPVNVNDNLLVIILLTTRLQIQWMTH